MKIVEIFEMLFGLDEVVLVLTVKSSGFFETLMGRGRWRILGFSGRRLDRGGRLGGDDPVDNRDNGRREDVGDRDSILATTMIGVMLNAVIGGAGASSGTGSSS